MTETTCPPPFPSPINQWRWERDEDELAAAIVVTTIACRLCCRYAMMVTIFGLYILLFIWQNTVTLRVAAVHAAHLMIMIVVQLISILGLCVVASCRGLTMCTLRLSLAKAEQVDDNGLRCWDTLPVPACGGRCDSREISDWEFPFKKSHHPVCVHGSRRAVTARLRHCDKGVAEGTDVFRFIAAEDCRCKICSSQYTSCQWLPPNSTLLDNLDRLEDEE